MYKFDQDFVKKQQLPPVVAKPWAFHKILEHIKLRYGNPPIIIHENGRGKKKRSAPQAGLLCESNDGHCFDTGYAEFDINSTTQNQNDTYRAYYIEQYIEDLLLAIR